MNEDEKRKLLDKKQKENLQEEIDWMWEQYQNSGFCENPEMNFRKYCESIGRPLLSYRNRKDGYGD
jgi:hypothetical protein